MLPPGERGLIRARHGVTELRAIGTQMHEGLRQAFRGVDFWVGISRMRLHPRDIEEAVAEAEQAVALSRMLESDPRAVLFDDALLAAALGANTILRDQLASILDPVAEGDPKMGGALLSSIGAFFRSDMSIRGAAHLLGVHRHTLEYRLRRAENLLGRSIRRGPDRLLIEVALMAAGMRSGPKSGRPQSSPR